MLLPGADPRGQQCDDPGKQHGDDPETRLDRLVEFVVELASGHLDTRMAPSTRNDEIDSVVVGLNMLAEELEVLTDNLEKRVGERTRELAEAREQLHRMAMHDPLTGLANRTLLTDRLADAITEARDAAPPAVIVLDLDGFKAVNDNFGHAVGDQLLIVVAARLRRAVRPQDTVARLGGDEFAVVVADAAPHEVLAVARRVQQRVPELIVVAGHSCTVAASIGVRFGTERSSPATLLDDADVAMYAVKAEAPGEVRVFDPTMRSAARVPASTCAARHDVGRVPADAAQLALFPVAPFEDAAPNGGPGTAL